MTENGLNFCLFEAPAQLANAKQSRVSQAIGRGLRHARSCGIPEAETVLILADYHLHLSILHTQSLKVRRMEQRNPINNDYELMKLLELASSP